MTFYLLEISIWHLSEQLSLRIIPGLVLGILITWAAWKFPELRERFRKASFPTLFYFSAIAFGFAHFQDYGDSNILYSSLMMGPYIISGLLFAFARLKHGFRYSLLFHRVNNLLASIVPLILMIS